MPIERNALSWSAVKAMCLLALVLAVTIALALSGSVAGASASVKPAGQSPAAPSGHPGKGDDGESDGCKCPRGTTDRSYCERPPKHHGPERGHDSRHHR